MKTLLLAVAIALIASGSALALDKRAPRQGQIRESKAMVVETDAYDVYINGRLIGRDPDPAIRQSLRDNYYVMGR